MTIDQAINRALEQAKNEQKNQNMKLQKNAKTARQNIYSLLTGLKNSKSLKLKRAASG